MIWSFWSNHVIMTYTTSYRTLSVREALYREPRTFKSNSISKQYVQFKHVNKKQINVKQLNLNAIIWGFQQVNIFEMEMIKWKSCMRLFMHGSYQIINPEINVLLFNLWVILFLRMSDFTNIFRLIGFWIRIRIITSLISAHKIKHKFDFHKNILLFLAVSRLKKFFIALLQNIKLSHWLSSHFLWFFLFFTFFECCS